jgi:hypothetical protein
MSKIISYPHQAQLDAYLQQLHLHYTNSEKMIITLTKNRIVGDVWQDFNNAFPFLRIDFYKYSEGRLGGTVKQRLSKSASMASAGIRREGEIEILDTMTVQQLIESLAREFGLSVHVSRQSGNTWLETTMSDSWTLQRQNDHGRELSEPVKKGFAA